MTNAAFSDARRSFEVLPGIGCLEHSIKKLARAGVEVSLIRSWSTNIAAEYGILAYARPPVLDRLIAAAAAESAVP